MKRAFAAAGSWLAALAIVAGERPAHAQASEAPEAAPEPPETSFDGNLLRLVTNGATAVVDLGCPGRSVLRTRSKLFVACGAAGVVRVDVTDPTSPRRDGAMQVDGDATGLFLRDGHVWVEITHVDARPVRVEPVALPPLPTAPQVASPPPQREVTFSEESPAHANSAKESPSLVAPPRQGNIWDMSFETSAFITLGALGAGVLGSASVAYRFEGPFVVRAEVTPFGIAGPSQSTAGVMSQSPGIQPIGATATSQNSGSNSVTTAAAHLLAGIDTQFIEVALGIGVATVNQDLGSNTSATPDTSALSIAESARIGARDGLALNLESSAVAANRQFNLGYFLSSVQIPLSRKIMLMIRGGGGPVGFAYGDLGIRALIRGDGGKGTVALTGFAGGAGILVDLCSTNPVSPNTTACNNSTLAGPSLGGAVEWKL